MVKRNTTIISQKEYDDARMEYGEFLNKSVIINVNRFTINEVWGIYDITHTQKITIRVWASPYWCETPY